MTPDIATARAATPAQSPMTGREPAGLTRRATLNAGAAVVDYAVKIGTSLVVTPILVSGLGRSWFGVWEMLTRLFGYVSAADGRPTEGLRLVVAQLQARDDRDLKRRYVGAAVVVWSLMLPLVLGAGAALVAIAPGVTGAPPELHSALRLTSGLLVLNVVLATLGTIPESVLRGENLGYRRLGLQAGISVLGGTLAAGAVLLGFGLPGVAAAQVLATVAAGFTFLLVARTWVAWLGVRRPHRSEVRHLFGMSLWLTGGELVARLLLASDVVILGAVMAPAVVTTYVLTGYAARSAVGVHALAAGGAMPGVGGLLGAGEHARAGRARQELLVLTWLFGTLIGGAILLWNRSFIGLWVGLEHYAGLAVDALIVLLTVQTAFIRVDAYMIDAALAPRQRVAVSGLAAAVSLGLAIPLTYQLGIVGLCLGLFAGRLVQSFAYPLLVRRVVGRASEGMGTARLAVTSGVLVGLAAVLGQRLVVEEWLTWVLGLLITVPTLAALGLWLGPRPAMRRAVLARCRALSVRGRPR